MGSREILRKLTPTCGYIGEEIGWQRCGEFADWEATWSDRTITLCDKHKSYAVELHDSDHSYDQQPGGPDFEHLQGDLAREIDKVLEQAGPPRPFTVEVRENLPGELDEIVLTVDRVGLFHLEQMDDRYWWMRVGSPDHQYVHVKLYARRATVLASWDTDGRTKVEATTPATRSNLDNLKE